MIFALELRGILFVHHEIRLQHQDRPVPQKDCALLDPLIRSVGKAIRAGSSPWKAAYASVRRSMASSVYSWKRVDTAISAISSFVSARIGLSFLLMRIISRPPFWTARESWWACSDPFSRNQHPGRGHFLERFFLQVQNRVRAQEVIYGQAVRKAGIPSGRQHVACPAT